MTSRLESLLRERISAAGAITFAEYMEKALYDPLLGYYTRGVERSGWGGDFITSPQLDPAFGALWAGAFQEVWEEAGRPDRFELVELGPGEGGFAAALTRTVGGSALGEALHITLVERSPTLRARQQEHLRGARVKWASELTAVPAVGCGILFANEVLDNQPVHLLEARGGRVFELLVTVSGEILTLEESSLSDRVNRYLDRNPVALPDGHRLEVSPAADELVRSAAQKLETGAIIFIDYGAEAADLAAKPDGSLLCYSTTGTDTNYLDKPGEKDLTAFADWTMVRRALTEEGCRSEGPLPQAEILRALGAGSIDDALRKSYEEAIAEKRDRDALRLVSRRQALGALLDPGGLGGLGVVAGIKGLPEGFRLL